MGCLLGNLISQHALTWFWIVLAAQLMVAALTLLPTFVPQERRGAAALGGFTAALVLLLGVCCLYCGGTWFPVAAVSVVFGLGLVFLPFVLRTLPLPAVLSRRKSALYVGIELALLLALYGAACLYTGGTWFLSAALWTVFGLGILLLPPLLPQLPLPWSWDRHKALVYLSFETLLLLAGLAWEGRAGGFLLPMLPTAALCLTLPWGLLGLLRYLPWNRWFRGVDRPVAVAVPLWNGSALSGQRRRSVSSLPAAPAGGFYRLDQPQHPGRQCDPAHPAGAAPVGRSLRGCGLSPAAAEHPPRRAAGTLNLVRQQIPDGLHGQVHGGNFVGTSTQFRSDALFLGDLLLVQHSRVS